LENDAFNITPVDCNTSK